MSIGGGGSDVEVKFGGTTSGLDAASTAAANDIRKVGNEAKKAEAPLKGLAGVFAHMKSEFKRGFSEEMARSGQDFTQFGGTAGGVLDGVTTKLQDIKGAMIITGLAAATLGGAIALVKWGGQFGTKPKSSTRWRPNSGWQPRRSPGGAT